MDSGHDFKGELHWHVENQSIHRAFINHPILAQLQRRAFKLPETGSRLRARVSTEGCLDMPGPEFDCGFPFCQELMPLVDSHNSADRPALMVQDLVGDMRCYAQGRHAGGNGTPEVMQDPALDA